MAIVITGTYPGVMESEMGGGSKGRLNRNNEKPSNVKPLHPPKAVLPKRRKEAGLGKQ